MYKILQGIHEFAIPSQFNHYSVTTWFNLEHNVIFQNFLRISKDWKTTKFEWIMIKATGILWMYFKAYMSRGLYVNKTRKNVEHFAKNKKREK